MIPKSKCIKCKKVLWDDYPSPPPIHGDFSICIYCGTIHQFDNKLKLIKPKGIIPTYAMEAAEIIKIAIKFGVNIIEFVKKRNAEP